MTNARINVHQSALMPINVAPTAPVVISADSRSLVDMWLSGRSARTIRAYRADLADLAGYLGMDTAEQAASLLIAAGQGQANAIVHSYRAAMCDRGLSPATANRRLAAVRSLVQLARTVGMISWALDVPSVRSQAYRDTRGPGQVAARAMLDRAADRASQGPRAARDYAIYRLLHDLALRRGELVSLDLNHVDLRSATISVLGKGKHDRQILSLPDPTKAALAQWISHRGYADGPLFTNFDRAGKGQRLTGTSIYRIIRSLGAEIGVQARPHGLRHTAITTAIQAAQTHGIGLEEVRDYSRHASIATLMIYRDRDRDVQGTLAAMVAQ